MVMSWHGIEVSEYTLSLIVLLKHIWQCILYRIPHDSDLERDTSSLIRSVFSLVCTLQNFMIPTAWNNMYFWLDIDKNV